MKRTGKMLPEAEQDRFTADLEAESRICSDAALDDPTLLADRQLRQQLALLRPAALPASVRRRLMCRLPLRPVWPVAIAASVLAAVVLGLSLRATPAPTSTELQQLSYALVVIGQYSHDGFQRAARHGADTLDWPLLEAEALPYYEWIRPALSGPVVSISPNQEYAR